MNLVFMGDAKKLHTFKHLCLVCRCKQLNKDRDALLKKVDELECVFVVCHSETQLDEFFMLCMRHRLLRSCKGI